MTPFHTNSKQTSWWKVVIKEKLKIE
jgi:hypothetical protein